MKTRITELFGIEYPIVSAGMGGVALAELAAAVSEAGGIGTIALAGLAPEAIQNEIAAARKLTRKPLMVNLLVPFLRPGIVEMVSKQPIDGITFFWGEPRRVHPDREKVRPQSDLAMRLGRGKRSRRKMPVPMRSCSKASRPAVMCAASSPASR